MAQQKAQGTITIIDTNEIERVYPVYCKGGESIAPSLEPLSNWKEEISEITVTGNYIWQRIVTKKYGINVTAQDYSDAVRLTGLDGIDITDISITYCNHTYNDDSHKPIASGSGAGGHSGWQTNVPSYDGSYPYYWVKTTITYSEGNPSVLIHYDAGLSDANAAAALANSIATHSNEMANGAMSQANNGIKEIYRIWYRTNSSVSPKDRSPATWPPSAHVTTSNNDVNNTWTKVKPTDDINNRYYFYCNETITNGGISSWTDPVLDTSNLSQYEIGALETKVKNHWWDSEGAHIASGIKQSGDTEARAVTEGDYSTYGFNAVTKLTGISFNYNAAKVIDLSTTPSPTSLKFYQPPTISNNTATQGQLTMALTSNALNFYDPTDGTTEQAKLDANGLVLKKGGIKAGTVGQSDFIYLSTEDYPLKDETNNIEGITINEWTPSVTGTREGQLSNDPAWRQIIGTNFGVDAEGNLYASNANLSGVITAIDGFQVIQKNTNTLLTEVNQNGLDVYGEIIPYYSGGAMPAPYWGRIAHFGETTQIGGDAAAHTTINTNGIGFYAGENYKFGQIDFHIKHKKNTKQEINSEWEDYTESSTYMSTTLDYATRINGIDAYFNFSIMVADVEESEPTLHKYEVHISSDNYYMSETCNDGPYNFTVTNVVTGDEASTDFLFTITDNLYGGGTSIFQTFESKIIIYYDQDRYAPHYEFGFDVDAIGQYAFAMGNSTIAREDCQLAIGQFNISTDNALFVIGNGTNDNNRSNLMTVGTDLITIGSETSNHLSLTENGLKLYNSSNNIPIASFGDTIQVGSSEGFHIQIDSRELGFYQNQIQVAYINDQKLSIGQSVVLEQMDIGRKIGEQDPFDPTKTGAGQWSWAIHKNAQGKNNLYLKWIG